MGENRRGVCPALQCSIQLSSGVFGWQQQPSVAGFLATTRARTAHFVCCRRIRLAIHYSKKCSASCRRHRLLVRRSKHVCEWSYALHVCLYMTTTTTTTTRTTAKFAHSNVMFSGYSICRRQRDVDIVPPQQHAMCSLSFIEFTAPPTLFEHYIK